VNFLPSLLSETLGCSLVDFGVWVIPKSSVAWEQHTSGQQEHNEEGCIYFSKEGNGLVFAVGQEIKIRLGE
jgi:hypothetical protein